jgi:hypothetical protein
LDVFRVQLNALLILVVHTLTPAKLVHFGAFHVFLVARVPFALSCFVRRETTKPDDSSISKL